MTNVYKPLKKKIINLDTKFCDDYYTSGTTNITLPERINDVKSIKMLNIELPLSYYNISSSLNNNCFTITDSSNNVAVITIPDGSYTINTIKIAINTSIQLSEYKSLIYDISGNYSTFISSIGLTVSFDVGKTGFFDKYNFKSKLGWLLGYQNIRYFVSTMIVLSDSFIDLNGSRYFYIVLDDYSKNGFTNNFIGFLPKSIINKNIIAKLQLSSNVEYGSILTANKYNGLLLSDKRTFSGKTDLQKFNIQIINEWGIVVNLNGLDFSFSLGVEYE
jgi:hypothetical protein